MISMLLLSVNNLGFVSNSGLAFRQATWPPHQAPCRHRHNLQECRRLEPPQRSSTPFIEETWTAQTGHDANDPDGYDVH